MFLALLILAQEKKTKNGFIESQIETREIQNTVNSLDELEKDIDNMTSRVEEMKKHIIVYSSEEIENLMQQIISNANEEAKKIIDKSRSEAEEESALIIEEAERNLLNIKKSIDSSSSRAVDSIIKMVLGETYKK